MGFLNRRICGWNHKRICGWNHRMVWWKSYWRRRWLRLYRSHMIKMWKGRGNEGHRRIYRQKTRKRKKTHKQDGEEEKTHYEKNLYNCHRDGCILECIHSWRIFRIVKRHGPDPLYGRTGCGTGSYDQQWAGGTCTGWGKDGKGWPSWGEDSEGRRDYHSGQRVCEYFPVGGTHGTRE